MSQVLINKHVSAGSVRCLPARAYARRTRTRMVARAEGRVVREYREDDDKIVNTASKTPEEQALYAQAAKVSKPQGLSKEYKNKLREEYVGFGGAEGKAMSQNWFLVMITVVGVLAIMCKGIGAI